jgi:CheY-like chemotaxis protein
MKILAVDDNRDLCLNIRDVLELHGHIVTTAYDGYEAIELARRCKPDFALVDVGMPRLDGATTLFRLKRLLPGLRGALMTGWPPDDDAELAAMAGALCCLSKPLDFPLLLELMQVSEGERVTGEATTSRSGRHSRSRESAPASSAA